MNRTVPKPISHSHDKFFKTIFNKKEAVAEFIEKILPTDIAKQIDLTTLTLDNNEYTDEKLKNYCSDIVYNCDYQNNQQNTNIQISLIFEHKSYPEQYPHLQLMRYLLNAWESQLKQKQALTPIIPIIFYHGKKKWKQKPLTDYFEQELDSTFKQFLPNFNYLLVDAVQHSNAEFKQLSNLELQIGLLLMKHIFDSERLLQDFVEIFSDINQLFNTKQGNDYFETLVIYLYNNTDLSIEQLEQKMNNISAETRENFISTAMQLQMKGKKEGIKEGIKEGLLKTAKNLKQMGLETEIIVKGTGLSAVEIEKL